ncbi:hypothetical protein M440DRAFT_1355487 [Trichoderma longibrachiatum ATCC 18648]|uniref:DUF4419 domain-containing protein n=1 Tax=Trichoderma longibrachiatum ATCC 18648 TaxID=983965 RepID=A0A2T4C675_TRILO|nr:hypothetical protein M440DRAFT_1355487 [Trichoderma longibrachiatum ATCC 18648]
MACIRLSCQHRFRRVALHACSSSISRSSIVVCTSSLNSPLVLATSAYLVPIRMGSVGAYLVTFAEYLPDPCGNTAGCTCTTMLLEILLLSGLYGRVPVAAASITVPVDPDVDPLPLSAAGTVTSASELLRQSCPEEFPPRTPYSPELLMSSFADFGSDDSDAFANGTIYMSSDSLVRGAIEAWGQHQSLILRPDEVWFEILAQLNFYMTAHAEDVRHLFVDHEGKEEIQVWRLSWRDVIAAFGGEIQKRVKTDWLLDWIMPGFSTSDDNDGLTATVLMMGLMQHYFEFSGGIICGLPEVTLLGERDDWVKLLEKLDRLKEWGEEPADYAERLRPILTRFVGTWDEPDSDATKDFWKNIVRSQRLVSCGTGPADYSISGWITGFLHWTVEGNLRISREAEQEFVPSDRDVVLDGVPYFSTPLDDVPVGYAKAPLWFLFGPVNASVETGPWYGNGGELARAAAGLGMCETNTGTGSGTGDDAGGLIGDIGDGDGSLPVLDGDDDDDDGVGFDDGDVIPWYGGEGGWKKTEGEA